MAKGNDLGRFGSDDFVVIGEGTDPERARLVADRNRRGLEDPMTGASIKLAAGVGGLVTADPCVWPKSLLGEGKMVVGEAKCGGGNGAEMLSPARRSHATERLGTMSDLGHALDNGELRLFYQPIHHLAAGRVVGYEALLRWRHPKSGLLMPGRFIEDAEASGMIVPLGHWALRTGCLQSANWRRRELPAKVSINVSGRQLIDPDFAQDVAQLLCESGARPSDIHLEVTERVLISDLERARDALDALHALGVHLGLDDFGTGWSSLSQLAFLPFDFVKIDRCFVHGVEADQRAALLLRSIVGLCKTLGLRVVVEGIETADQLEYVKSLGVRMGQGFLLGRPAPAAMEPGSSEHVSNLLRATPLADRLRTPFGEMA
jgi:EAL domain-containing protein (putative c-di-GMP-specific phosphodiesterase class I)